MRTKNAVKLPRMYVIKFEKADNKIVYLRYASFITSRGDVEFKITLVTNRRDASRFMGADNSKTIARKIRNEKRFVQASIIDCCTKQETFVK